MTAAQWVRVKRESELKPGDEVRPTGACACGRRHSVTLVKKCKHKDCACGPDCTAPGWLIAGHCKALPDWAQYCLQAVIGRGGLERRVEVAPS